MKAKLGAMLDHVASAAIIKLFVPPKDWRPKPGWRPPDATTQYYQADRLHNERIELALERIERRLAAIEQAVVI